MKINRTVGIVAAALVLGAGCTQSPPTLPSDTSPAGVAELVSSPDGTKFLEEISSYQWSDEGSETSGIFDWIAPDATSSDPQSAARAGETAHALAAFLADHRGDSQVNSSNEALLAGYADALSPYQGAMVGDSRGTSGFEPLDNLEGVLPRTARVFAAMLSTATASEQFAGEAQSRAETYETEFAQFAASNPTLPDGHIEQSYALWSARLRGLLARGEKLANPDDKAPEAAAATTQLRFAIVSRMVQGSDPRISKQYFTDEGTLIAPETLNGGPLSLYSAQLINYLSTYPRLTAAVAEFDQTLNSIEVG